LANSVDNVNQIRSITTGILAPNLVLAEPCSVLRSFLKKQPVQDD